MDHEAGVSTAAGVGALTEKEKQTLRLLLVGHDAKSMARHFGLSVHTVNERLRDARRKLAVSSSRQAARLLHEAERADPENQGDAPFGDAPAGPAPQPSVTPDDARSPSRRRPWVIGGLVMTLVFAALLALALPTAAPFPPAESGTLATDTAAGQAARAFLVLVDEAKWPESWAATGASFHRLNTVAAWQKASEQARAPLGPVLSRTLVDELDTPTPPAGTRTVRFRTDFANAKGKIETVALDEEGSVWKVVGVYVE